MGNYIINLNIHFLNYQGFEYQLSETNVCESPNLPEPEIVSIHLSEIIADYK